MNIYLELFGYLGTGLVFLSMMMTTLTRLRILNMAGSVISGIYSALMGAYPVVVLNIGLLLINTIQLIREFKNKQKKESDHETDH